MSFVLWLGDVFANRKNRMKKNLSSVELKVCTHATQQVKVISCNAERND